MTEHDKQQTTSGLSPSDRADQRGILASSLRRRLVKGTALALPAIITLSGAEAQAAVSLTCKVRTGQAGNGSAGTATVVTTSDGPDYVRQTVAVYADNGSTGTTQRIIMIQSMNVWRNYTDGLL